ncbi:[citrate (pro-3S)-lyase] ligase [Deltaproteobacteria bacterium OttesenSCG-928-M10]|nr:[citrate (pro-3S)-lyase] ligase [Deltaproteobacteria bacterium OttesenSCG-928-M10]
MLDDLEPEIVDRESRREIREVSAFLAAYNLEYEGGLDYTVALRRDGAIVATGSFKGEVIRNIAVNEDLQGRGLTAAVVSALMREQARRGIVHYFIFTKPDKAFLFAGLGFTEIVRVDPYVALLETGLGSVGAWCAEVSRELADLGPGRAGLVMNCNPFTKGHEALIRRAAAENEAVVVFVVSEDRSVFPFGDRLRLVREGTRGLTNVRVVPSGKYMISEATFPAYFLKGGDQAVAQARLDITLFAEKIAPALNIVSRYVGEEPACPVTRAYNEAMLAMLPACGLEVKVMPRILADGEFISASAVREAWLARDWAKVAAMVPEHTLAYLRNQKDHPDISRNG